MRTRHADISMTAHQAKDASIQRLGSLLAATYSDVADKVKSIRKQFVSTCVTILDSQDFVLERDRLTAYVRQGVWADQ